MPSMPPGRLAAVVVCAAMFAAGTSPARADVIDGQWCFTDGQRYSIRGPSMITPAGSHIQGDYARHFFAYVAPPTDAHAGQTISISLVNEDTVQLRIGSGPSYSSDGPVQIWHRCGPPIS
jgi:hypothetical protein